MLAFCLVLGEYRVLTGPTAGGKTDWLVRRSAQVPALAISADSRQIYRYMDIGTGKASPADRAILPHYAIDVLNPNQGFSVYQYVFLVAGILRDIEASGEAAQREVWIVGGTGLYLRAVMDDLELGLAPRARLRQVIQDRLAYMGPRVVAESLGLLVNEPDNPVRVQRAAEQACVDGEAAIQVYLRAGLSVGDYESDLEDLEREPGQTEWNEAREQLRRWHCRSVYVLDPGREELQRRIGIRVARMFALGLADEVRRLRDLGFGETAVVRDGIGYREAGAVLDNRMGAQEAIQQAITRTRQYAKRQRTYFRGQHWTFVTESELNAALLADGA